MIPINRTLHQFQKGNVNFEYGRYSRNDVIKRDLGVVWSHDYCADPKKSLFRRVKSLKLNVFWRKLADDDMKICSQFRCGNVTWATKFRFWIGCQNLADRLILSDRMKKIRKISIEKYIQSNFFFQVETSKVTIQRKK